jgi:hypothetical protein
LPVAIIQLAFRAPLVAAVGTAPLLKPRFSAAGRTAVAPSTITVLTDPEHRVAAFAAANPLPENDFAMSLHVRPQTGLDNGSRSCQVKIQLDAW